MAEDTMDEGALATAQKAVATPPTLMVDPDLMRLARQNPRDEDELMETLNRDLVKHSGFADELFYSIPYKDNRKKVINFVEGPSIRAAEHMWSRWGNCTVAARVADDRGNKVMVQGLYLDHQTGLRLFSDLEVDKMMRRRDGGTYMLLANDLRIKVQATESKAKRNAFLSAVPVWMKNGYIDKCFELSMGVSKKPINDRIIDAKLFFMSKFKVQEKSVLDLIVRVKDSYPGIDDNQLLRYLIGLKNALKDGNAEIDFVFGEAPEPAAMPRSKKEKEAAREESKPADTTAPAATEEAAGDAQEPA